MSRWDDQFDEHAVFAALAAAREQLDSISAQIEDTAERESQVRLIRVCEYVEAALRAADPELVPFPVLDQLAQAANQITSYLQQYAAAPSSTWLDNSNGQADALLQQVLLISPRVTPSDVQELQSAVSTFRRSAGQHLRNIEGEVAMVRSDAQTVETQVAAQETKIQAQDARLDAVVTEYQAQFSAAQEQRQTQFAQVLEEGRTNLRETTEESKLALKVAVDEATEQLEELLVDAEEKSRAALTAAQERADAQHEELTTESSAKMKQLDELLAKAVRTVGAIGSTGMAGGYKIVADEEKKQADRWRITAAVALLGAIAATIFAVVHGVEHGFQVDTFFAKWAISVPFAALAGYAARESSKHREESTGNRKIELQLASLDTYLVNLPEAEQNKIRAKLADRFFGELPAVSTEGITPVLDS
jgi:hypothetical protein